MSDATPEPADAPIDGGSRLLTRSVLLAAEYLADCVERDCGAKYGRTALYWAIVGTLAGHAGKKGDGR